MQRERGGRGAANQQVGRAGEYFVVAELNKRGAFAVPFAGNMPKIDLIACNHDQSRTIHIQVKTKRGGANMAFKRRRESSDGIDTK
jgi:Holliday junction resolvase-like predicted endonuclease